MDAQVAEAYKATVDAYNRARLDPGLCYRSHKIEAGHPGDCEGEAAVVNGIDGYNAVEDGAVLAKTGEP